MRLAEKCGKTLKKQMPLDPVHTAGRTFMFQWQYEDPFDPVNWKSRSSLWCPSGAESPKRKEKTKPEKHYHTRDAFDQFTIFPASVSMSNACMCVFVEAFQLLNMTEHQRWAFRRGIWSFFRLEVIAWAVGVELTSVQINAWNGSQTHSQCVVVCVRLTTAPYSVLKG